jgi:hypothetical protein
MQENRSSPRKQLNEKIDVLDINSGELLGTLVNISPGGFMLFSNKPVDSNRLFQLRLQMPEADAGETLELGAESLWCKDTTHSRGYWAGFQIIDISEQGIRQVKQLFDNWAK